MSRAKEVFEMALSSLGGIILMWHLTGLGKRLGSRVGGRGAGRRRKKPEGASFRNEPIDPR